MKRYLYLHGFASGPESSKARMFKERFASCGIDLIVPDLAEGDFEHLTLTRQLHVVERELNGAPAVLIGSSMGGYLAALYAARHPEVERLVLLAPAFGFAKRLPAFMPLSQFEVWKRTGWHEFFHYGIGAPARVHFELIEDGERYEEYPDVRQPVLILHGDEDHDVPVRLSEEFAAQHPNARLIVLPDGHQLLDHLDRLWEETRAFVLAGANRRTGTR
jgi:pimeloyl-ACP methyl ester carboxylesterase